MTAIQLVVTTKRLLVTTETPAAVTRALGGDVESSLGEGETATADLDSVSFEAS